MAYKQFQKGSGCFTCEACGKKTRQTEGNNANKVYCIKCIDEFEKENSEDNRQ
jgi:hypothetical protein